MKQNWIFQRGGIEDEGGGEGGVQTKKTFCVRRGMDIRLEKHNLHLLFKVEK